MEEDDRLLEGSGGTTGPPQHRKQQCRENRRVTTWSLVLLMRPYLWPERFMSRLYVFCTFVMVICAKVCSVLAPLFLAHAANLLNDAVQTDTSLSANKADSDPHTAIAKQVCYYCLLCFLAVLCAELQTLIYMQVKQEANVVLCTQAYAHVLSLSVNWHISQKTGCTLRILERGGKAADELVGYLLLNFCPGMVECLCVCVLFILKFHQVEIFIIAAVGVCVYGVLTRYVTSQRKQLRKKSNSYDNLYSEMASDSFANIEQVKCCNGEKFEINRYGHAVAMYNQSRKFILAATGVLKISQQCIISLTLFASLLITVKQVLRGDMNIGDFVAVHAYILGMFNPLNALGGNYNKIVQALVDVRQLADLLAEVPTVQDTDCARPIPILNVSNQDIFCHNCNEENEIEMMKIDQRNDTATEKNNIFHEKEVSIRFENVCFNYSSDYENNDDIDLSTIEANMHMTSRNTAHFSVGAAAVPSAGLVDISFIVPSGTTTAIVGSSGSGKTTISRMIFRFYDPCRGRVLFNDYDIKEYTQESIRSCISLVPQDTILFNNTILFNIQYGRLPGASMQQVEEACEAAQILKFIEALPNKWDTVVGERGMRLSGGEKQRVAIARCLLRNPPVIVLDEATSSLDSETEKSVQFSLQSLTQGQRTVVIIAHRLSTIQTVDQILVLDKGEIIQRGTHEQLLGEVKGKYKMLWESQYRDDYKEKGKVL